MVLIGLSKLKSQSNATLGATYIVDHWEIYQVCENNEVCKHFGFCNGVLYDRLLSPTTGVSGKCQGCFNKNSNQSQRRKYLSSYEVNAIIIYLTVSLIICGDIHPCSGPARQSKYSWTDHKDGEKDSSSS